MRLLALLLFLSFASLSFSQDTPDPLLTNDVEQQTKWVDSVYQSMSLKERIGQLFTPMVFSSQDEKTHQGIITVSYTHLTLPTTSRV